MLGENRKSNKFARGKIPPQKKNQIILRKIIIGLFIGKAYPPVNKKALL